MAGFRNIRSYADCTLAGRTHTGHFRKVPSQTTVAGNWYDVSMAAGNPLPNYYASPPLVASVLDGFRGIWAGDEVETDRATTASLGGNISGTTFTDTAHGTGLWEVGMVLTGTNVTPGTTITAFGTGTGQNSGGTYIVSPSQTVTAQTISGSIASGRSKHLRELMLVTPTAGLVGQYMLLDYLLYYPFVDCDDLDTQAMANTTTLPRYTDGEGVMVMAVNVAPTVGGGVFTFDYIDQDGNAKTSPAQGCGTTAANIGTLCTSQQAVANAVGPFLKLADGTTGVRSITSVTFTVANGGLIALVLVKPLLNSGIREVSTPKEVEMIREKMALPRIYDGAYLNLIMSCAATVAAGLLVGRASFTWSE